jgi:serine/threonine protein kinase
VVEKHDPVSYNTLLNGFKILKQLGTKTNNRELEIGKKYIVTFLDTVETSTHFGVVMEEIKGMELFDYVLKNHVVIHGEALGLSEPVAKVIMKQILLGNQVAYDSHGIYS